MLMKHKFLIGFLFLFVFMSGPQSINLYASGHNDSFKIAIFKEDGFPYKETPKDLTVEWLGSHIEGDFDILFLNTEGLNDRSLLNAGNVDLLILPYGESVPEEGLLPIVKFIKNGGGLFTTAGRPFGSVFKKGDKYWEEVDSLDAERYLGELGINCYKIYKEDIASAHPGVSYILDGEFEMNNPPYDQYGLYVKTSEKIYNKPPTAGNVFPHRIPARVSVGPLMLMDRDNNYIGAPLILVKSWKNPYRSTERIPEKWCLAGFVGEDHPLNPNDKNSVERLKNIIDFLSTRFILTQVGTEYASYRKGETVNITARVLNYGTKKRDVTIDFFLIEENEILLQKEKRIFLEGLEEKEVGVAFESGKMTNDFYEIKAILSLDNRIIDEVSNGFTVWHADRLRKGQDITVKGKQFYRDNRPLYLYGTNYYESSHGELMWVNPNMHNIHKDICLMSGFGINFLRVHYHHPKWFRDYLKTAGPSVSDYFQNLADSPLPDEGSLRILDAFIILCHKYNIYFQPDLFTLVPEEMGSPRGWIGDLQRCTDYEKIEVQKKFVKILSERYNGIKNITWDLWNEPFLGQENIYFLRNWVKEMVDSFRSNGDRHLITLGSDESIEMADVLDFICGHGHDIEIPDSDKPFVMQEIWNEADLTPEGEKNQALKLERDFEMFTKKAAAGFVPWQWTRQSRLWDEMGAAERWDNELGLCVREDGSMKPAGKIYKKLINRAQ